MVELWRPPVAYSSKLRSEELRIFVVVVVVVVVMVVAVVAAAAAAAVVFQTFNYAIRTQCYISAPEMCCSAFLQRTSLMLVLVQPK
jgi:hypothetical protein